MIAVPLRLPNGPGWATLQVSDDLRHWRRVARVYTVGAIPPLKALGRVQARYARIRWTPNRRGAR